MCLPWIFSLVFKAIVKTFLKHLRIKRVKYLEACEKIVLEKSDQRWRAMVHKPEWKSLQWIFCLENLEYIIYNILRIMCL